MSVQDISPFQDFNHGHRLKVTTSNVSRYRASCAQELYISELFIIVACFTSESCTLKYMKTSSIYKNTNLYVIQTLLKKKKENLNKKKEVYQTIKHLQVNSQCHCTLRDRKKKSLNSETRNTAESLKQKFL